MDDAQVVRIQREQALARVRKRAWSREKCEELRAVGLMLDGDDSELVMDAAELLLEVRQAMRGGRLNVRGSRHWEDS